MILGRPYDLSFSRSNLFTARIKSTLAVFCDALVVSSNVSAVSSDVLAVATVGVDAVFPCDSSVIVSEELELFISSA
jgi:hypothetical protein